MLVHIGKKNRKKGDDEPEVSFEHGTARPTEDGAEVDVVG